MGKETKKTIGSERSGTIPGNSSSVDLSSGGKVRLNRCALSYPSDAAKVKNLTQKAKLLLKNFAASKHLDVSAESVNDLVRSIGKLFRFRRSKSSHSYYGTLLCGPESEEGERKVLVRVSNHPANGDNFYNCGTDEVVSIVIYKDGEIRGKADYQEVLYYPMDGFSFQDIADNIAKGMADVLRSGKFVDHSKRAVVVKNSNGTRTIRLRSDVKLSCKALYDALVKAGSESLNHSFEKL